MKSPALLLRVSLAGFIAASLFSGCQSYRLRRAPQPNLNLAPSFATASFVPDSIGSELPPLDPTLLQRPKFEYRLGPGDVLEMEIVGDPLSRARSLVGPDGKIYFHMLPGIDVWGMTVGETRTALVKEMQRYVREEQPISVTLVAAESQKVWVLGRVGKVGAFSMTGPMTLIDAVSAAGGPASVNLMGTGRTGAVSMASFTTADDAADLNRAFVMRDGKMLRVNFERLLREGDLSQNIYLQPDDFVYLPSATIGSVHVLGAVNAPRAVEYTNRMTLLQAVAQAGGTLIRESYPSQVAIVRGSLAEPRIAVVDLTAILRGTANDVLLEPQDIVYVPHSPYRVLTRLLDNVLHTFVRVVGVNEGARAVSDRAAPVGVNVPLSPL